MHWVELRRGKRPHPHSIACSGPLSSSAQESLIPPLQTSLFFQDHGVSPIQISGSARMAGFASSGIVIPLFGDAKPAG
jgi:hypothetical protein